MDSSTTLWPSGEPTVSMSAGGLKVTVNPLRGAKIVSLIDSRGVEWIAQPDNPVSAPPRDGAAFLDAEMAAWDECAPTIVACEVDGVALGDHGNLWTKEFAVSRNTVSVVDEAFGYTFSRTMRAGDDELFLDYEVEAGHRDIPFMWAAHPQFRAPEGSRVMLPSSVTSVVDVMDPALPTLDWAADLGAIDTIAPGGYRKFYVHPDQVARSAALVHPDGATLRLSWTAECPYFGVWFDRFDFRAEPIVALEPATAYFDMLTTSIELDRVMMIPAKSRVCWTLGISVLF